jgi:4'-phosphopantetheinyl transferase
LSGKLRIDGSAERVSELIYASVFVSLQGLWKDFMSQLTYLDIYEQGQCVDDLWIALSAIEIGDYADTEVLSGREQRIYKQFENNRRKTEFIGARTVLQQMTRQAGYDVNSFELKKTKQGRPYGITQTDQFKISIAHTDRYVLCGLSRNRMVGVDLEPVGRKIHQRLRKRILTAPEANNGRLRNVETVRIWTIKEAIVKLTGEGLSGLLSEMSIDRTGEELFTAVIGDRHIHVYSWRFKNQWIAVAIH